MPLMIQNTWFTYTGNGLTEENQLDIIRTATEIGVEDYWLDAGRFEGDWPNESGNWELRHDAFPNGLAHLDEIIKP